MPNYRDRKMDIGMRCKTVIGRKDWHNANYREKIDIGMRAG